MNNEKINEMISYDFLKEILGEDEMKDVAKTAMMKALEYYFNKKENLEYIIYKVAKKTTIEYFADQHEVDIRKVCADKIRDSISNDDHFKYTLFYEGEKGREILDDEINNARPFLREQIRKALERFTFKMDGQDIMEMIWEEVIYKLFEEKARDQMPHANSDVYMSVGEGG